MAGKILILIPGKNARGGITNYYKALKNYFGDRVLYCERGSRNWPHKTNKISALIRLVSDYIIFINHLLFKNIRVVQTTTAFYKDALLRDAIFIIIALIFRKEVIVFFRGWNDSLAYNLNGIYDFVVKKIFFKSRAIIDLSSKNIAHLKALGFKGKLYLETTLVDTALLEGFNLEHSLKKRVRSQSKNILFLSRIEKTKGIFEILKVYRLLKEKDDTYTLTFAGDGRDTADLKKKIEENNLKDVLFTGYVAGSQKKEIYQKAWLFIFLSEFEGMPNAVLEAMAMGLPVITTNVGGLKDVFTNHENGLLLDSQDNDSIIAFVESLKNNNSIYQRISENNYQKAKELFWSDKVAQRMLKIFKETAN